MDYCKICACLLKNDQKQHQLSACKGRIVLFQGPHVYKMENQLKGERFEDMADLQANHRFWWTASRNRSCRDPSSSVTGAGRGV